MAWQDLDSGRDWIATFGPPVPRRISWAAMMVWAGAHGLRDDEVDDLRICLAEMEQEFAAVEAERTAR